MVTATGADRKYILDGTSNNYLTLTGLVQSESAAVVYSGQKLVGTVIKRGSHYHAFDAVGRCLGNFSTRADATRSISHSRSVNNNTEAMNTALVR